MQNIWQHIYAAFIEADRWKLYLKGLGVTLEVSFFAALLGILIGTIAVSYTHLTLPTNREV